MKKIVDVRSPLEFSTGHYNEAMNHPLDMMIQGSFPDIPLDTEIQVCCRSGGRSAVAEQLMKDHGFTNVTNIGGYQG